MTTETMTIKDVKFLDNKTDDILFRLKDAKEAIEKGHTVKAIGTINGEDFIRTSRIVGADVVHSLITTVTGTIYRVQ